MNVVNRFCLFLLLIAAFPAYAISIEINDKGISLKEHHHGKVHWEAYRGMMPRNAVVGGQEQGRILYVCQAPYMGGMHPGKVVDGRCNITYAGREIPQPSFRVLVGRSVHWARSHHGKNLSNAVRGGHENGHPLFICQAYLGRSLHPGKVVGNNCNIGYGGREIAKMNYRVLMSGHPSQRPGYENENDGFGAETGGGFGSEPAPAVVVRPNSDDGFGAETGPAGFGAPVGATVNPN